MLNLTGASHSDYSYLLHSEGEKILHDGYLSYIFTLALVDNFTHNISLTSLSKNLPSILH